ncbi:MAG: hypothetical protein ABUS47_16475 [Steroidobacter sp.]
MIASRGSCKTCAHADRARIELMLANGVNAAQVSRQFNISHYSVWRHWTKHVSDDAKASLVVVGKSDAKIDLDALKRIESESLLQNLITERARLQRIADTCERLANFQDATRASAGIVKILEIAAKYLGELKTGNTTIHNNFLLSPDWLHLRRVIATALRPHAEAQRAVLAALQSYEHENGVVINHAHAKELPALPHGDPQ